MSSYCKTVFPGFLSVLKVSGIITAVLAGLAILFFLFITLVSAAAGIEDECCDDFGCMLYMAERES